MTARARIPDRVCFLPRSECRSDIAGSRTVHWNPPPRSVTNRMAKQRSDRRASHAWLLVALSSAARNHRPLELVPTDLDLRNLMVIHADGAKKIWGTETGAYTGTARGAVARDTQARFITDYLRLSSGWSSFTGPLFIYELRDGGTDRANREDNWGLLTTNGTPKPAWHAFTAALRR
jgi:hypothetical protein